MCAVMYSKQGLYMYLHDIVLLHRESIVFRRHTQSINTTQTVSVVGRILFLETAEIRTEQQLIMCIYFRS